jgi:CPA2 family monovalent cation:H+ antiporter-2
MVATPFLIQAAPRIGYALQSILSPESLVEPSMAGVGVGASQNMRGHVIIAGYGLNGRNLSNVLHRVKAPYVVLELNPEAVREARARGEPVSYGDCTRPEVLEAAGLDHARILVLAISDPIATRRAVQVARQRSRRVQIVVRTRYMSELSDLYDLGADQVIPEEFETSIEIFSRVLREYGMARHVIQREVEVIRREGYKMLRTPSLPLVEMSHISEALESASTETLFIDGTFSAVGKTLGELDLRRRTGSTVIAVSRQDNTEVNPGPDFKLQAEDIVVMLGSPENIDSAIEYVSRSE